MNMCEPGIREKFIQNPHLMDALVRRTQNKTIIECANDRLWGTGTALAEEGCLDRNRWITQGILGRILERIRAEFVSSCTIPTSAASTQPMYTVPPGAAQMYPYLNQPQLNTQPNYRHPPPGLNHPMVTIAQQPSVFEPTTLPVMTPEPENASHLQPIQEDTGQSRSTVTDEITNPVEPMDAQA